ncbi:MAG: diguanylate cyclase [Burkholderiales bacterium]|nr:diguanylate cyclase [Burkholderiales bacterium]
MQSSTLDHPVPPALPSEAGAGIDRLADAIDLPIGRWDARHRLVYCNGPYVVWAQRPREALLGRSLAEIFGDTAWAAASNAFAAAFSGRSTSYERRLTHLGASARWARIQVFPDRNDAGRIEGVYTVAFDIHDDVLRNEAANAARRRLQRFTENIPCPLTYVDRHFVLRFVNKAYTDVTGQTREQLIGRSIAEVRGPARWSEHQPYYERALGGEQCQYTRLVKDYVDGPRWLRTTYEPDLDDDGLVAGVYTLTMDVHDLTVAQERLLRRVERDELTDVFSRRTMMDHIDAAVAGASQQSVGLFFVDLDGFKAVNDAQGHAQGDRLLIGVARALQQAVRADDAVGRFGGDEFLVLAKVRDAAGGHVLAQHLLEAVREGCAPLAGGPQVTASIGYALAPADAKQPMRLLQLADDAMYAAKRQGKNRVMHGTDIGPDIGAG